MTVASTGFTRLDNETDLMTLLELPNALVKPYLFLLSRARLSRPAVHWGEVAAATGRSQRQTHEALRALAERGLAAESGAAWLAVRRESPGNLGETRAETSGKPVRKPAVGHPKKTVQHEENQTPKEGKKEQKEQKEEKQERECIGGNGGPPDHSLSEQPSEFLEEPKSATAGGASAEAPVGASPEPARPVTDPAQPPPEAPKNQATSTEKVPPAPPPGSARAALLTLFGSGFLGTLLGEAPGRAGWLELTPERIAELHQGAQAAVSGSPGKPWRTPLINALDAEAARRANVQFAPKSAEERTREEWFA